MPFYRWSVEMFEEIVSELDADELPPGFADNPPSGEFEYTAAAAAFAPEELQAVARLMLTVLRDAGATAFRVRYDGGYDEGFAHPEALLFGEERRPPGEVLPPLATPELIAQIREAAGRESMWGNAAAMYAEAPPVKAITYALDELAGELAIKLLGSGFGTGEGELYGALTADLQTGEIVDDPHAAPPAPAG
ncbi:MAG: hypothetical protein K0Q72_18 [Armatimonadetes bacterium]|jgi:hypothetical protein|nr:hypothetical protein [Armatimonadota bacterium]